VLSAANMVWPWMITRLSRGRFEVGTFTVGAWIDGDSQYVGSILRALEDMPHVDIRHWFCIGFSHVGLTGRIP